ncbi:MAG: proline--tRNA ligase, partial [Gallionellales bacterium RIFCSPLOWO2_02_58_13]
LADSGEDALAFCPDSDYAANVELAEAVAPAAPRADAAQEMQKTITPGQKTIEEVAAFFDTSAQKVLKAIAVMTHEEEFALLLLRGDHQLNELKAGKVLGEFRFATDDEIHRNMNCRAGYIGPCFIGQGNTGVRLLADRAAAAMSDFICGANDDGFHYTGLNFGRDVLLDEANVHDLRNVVAGDPSPDGKGALEICRGIEVGHIFQLRKKYAEALDATFLDAQGKSQIMEMGCYGIGVSRIVASAIEQNYDERGIVMPSALAPFQLAIVPIGMGKSTAVREAVEQLHAGLVEKGIEVLLDDRDERPGVMFADMELIGIPHRIVVGERGLKEGNVEYQARRDAQAQAIPLQGALEFIKSKLCG